VASPVPSRLRTVLSGIALTGILSAPVLSAPEAPTSSGSLAWVFAEDLDLVGSMRADLPAALSSRATLFVAAEADTAIERAQGLSFRVGHLGYVLETGVRLGAEGAPRVSLLAGVRGRDLVDDRGRSQVRYAGAAVETSGFRRAAAAAPLEGHLTVAAVVDELGVKADALLRAEARLSLPWERYSVGADLRIDGLVGSGRLRADLRGGPRIDLPVAGDRRLAFFLHYLRSRDPLGLGIDGLLLGLDFSEGSGAPAGTQSLAPDLSGRLGAGAGGDRRAGQFRILARFPEVGGAVWPVFDVDAHLVTSYEIDELYYLYHLGLERSRSGGIEGIYWYHRSNHQLGRFSDRVTSVNVLEVGRETLGWDGAGFERADRGRLDWRLRAGALLQSSFGYDTRLWLRGGLRWSIPAPWHRASPYVAAEGEFGDAGRRMAAAGVALSGGRDLRIEYRRDAQWYGEDRDALLVLGALVF
jgi:hypothetical protein